jgi:hypothetical protein
MRYHRVHKTAWELKAGDIIEQTVNGFEVLQPIRSVRKFLFDGEFEGRTYQRAPMSRIEFVDPPGVFLLAPGDRAFNVIRKKERAA